MPRLSALIIPAVVLTTTLCAEASNADSQSMWDVKALAKPPAVREAPGLEPLHTGALFYDTILSTPALKEIDSRNNRVRSLFYDGLPVNGKPTRVFAYYGTPEAPKGTKVPAMVLIHGGGGTAFESWVRLWNARGYAAIAMDVCGCVPKGEYGAWERHEYGGPAGWGGLDQIDLPTHDQWTYHAVADVVLAHSLIRSFPEIDAKKIGVTGLSWGGYLTSVVAGVDDRFRFAVPVYGCGFLGEDSCWTGELAGMGERGSKWLSLWDPSVYLRYAKAPMLWVSGTNDFAYHMVSWRKSRKATRGPGLACLRVNMPHAHGGAGENPEEILALADSFCKGGEPLASVSKQGASGGKVWAEFCSKQPLQRAELNFTRDRCPSPERRWETIPAELDSKGKASAKLPADVSAYYFNSVDHRGLVVSSDHVEIPQ